MVVMTLVSVENVIVVGVLYLSVCLVVRYYSGGGIGGDGWGWLWLFVIGVDGGIYVVVRMVTTFLRVAVVIRNYLFISILLVVFVVLVKLKIGWDLTETGCKVLSPNAFKESH